MSSGRARTTDREAPPAAAAPARPRNSAAPSGKLGLSGLRKAAVLLVTLDEDAAAAIFTRLPGEVAERVSREITALDAVGKEQLRAVVAEFRARAAEAGADPSPAPAFEDMQGVEDAAMRRSLAGVEPRRIALALKSASPELKAKVLRNLAAPAAEAVRDALGRMGPARVADVEAAQQAIVAAAGLLGGGAPAGVRGGSREGETVV